MGTITRTGIAKLPLHGGKCPAWLFSQMRKLAACLAEVIVYQFGAEEFLKRLSDPIFFQAFGCALGFDWHSSGLTTTVCGALKEGLREIGPELGIFVAGGKGRASRRTPEEISRFSEYWARGVDADNLIYASRMSAKVDNTALQDGYNLYHHTFFFTKKGNWCVIQQGMNIQAHWARRYHWLGAKVTDFVNEPHSAVCCDHKSVALNMVAHESEAARGAVSDLSRREPEFLIKELKKIKTLSLPRNESFLAQEINPDRLTKIFLETYQSQPVDFKGLLGLPGVGPKTIRALALLSELVAGAAPSFRDPVRYSFAHGGKDGYPYPVDRPTYSRTVEFLNEAISSAKMGYGEKLRAFNRLKSLL
jgi:hypothetical protein